MTALRLATLPFNAAFLDSLAHWWLDRAAREGTATGDALFLVPTRRAARGLAEAFLRHANGQALLLPRIVPLGGVDEAPLALAGALDLPPAVPPLRRLTVLTKTILALSGEYGAPVAADRAWLLAAELATLLDEAARAEIDLAAALPHAAAAEFASHWKVTLDFLGIVTRFWPDWLAEEGLADPVQRQIALLDAQGRAWAAAPPAHPVIAAGTTGAIPAVARLLRVVAALPQGQVVLPGLDLALDQASWDALEDSHPQASLRELLAELGAARGDVAAWDGLPAAPPGRVATLRTALLPAAALDQWRNAALTPPDGLMRLDAADEQEEAEAIALVLRETLNQQGARAALVTPDRFLARRVAAALLRYGVIADDSAGEQLSEVSAAVFLRLLAEAAAARYRPVPLLALLKHPYGAAGLAPVQCRAAARRLERACLRGPAPPPGLAGLRHDPDGMPPWDGKAAFLDRLQSCLSPLAGCDAAPAKPDAQLRALLAAAEAVAATDQRDGATVLWRGEDGEALADQLAALLDAWADLPAQDFATLPALLDAALSPMAVASRRALRGRGGTEHPRVFIWGLLEARLQTADTLVLGGLSEGVWPPAADPGPWMNRAMRRQAGLPSPEAAIGLAAHDFVACACAAERVVLSAPRRRDRAPCVPSRWLTRLEGLLAGHGLALERHEAALWAPVLDRPEGDAVPARPPAPAPAVAARPRRLSVTEIETWLRDPYAIYARHVLRLRRLAPIEESADAADYGRIVHAGLQHFHTLHGTAWPADAEARLLASMEAALTDARMRPALAAWWRPRLQRIAVWVAATEAERRAKHRLALISSERKGAWCFAAPAGDFTLTGRADRIERMVDGAIAILDYKTNAPPSQAAVENGLAPQLPLEAAMVAEGAFGAELAGRAVDLTYWQISGGATPGRVHQLFRGDGGKVAQAAEHAAAKLRALVADFDRPPRAYLSQPHPGTAPRFTDYAHLSRVPEWGAVEDEAPPADGA